MKWMVGLALFFTLIKGYGQGAMPDNLIRASARSPLVFTFQHAEELLTPRVINNAIEVKINPSLYQEYIVYAAIHFSDPSMNSIMNDLITLKLINSPGVGNKVHKELLPLSVTPVVVIQEFALGRTATPFSLFYELILNPVQQIIPAGNYNYTIQFILSPFLGGVPVMSRTLNVQGSIHIPPLYSFRIEKMNQQEIHFDNAMDFDKGKTYPAFYKATMISNIPCLVEVMTSGNRFSATEPGKEIPVNIISVRGNSGSSYVTINDNPQPLLFSNNKELVNVRYIDLRLEPGWNFPGGEYNILLNFIISAQ